MFNFLNEETGDPYEQTDLPEIINKFFSEIGPRLASEIPKGIGIVNVEREANQEVFELRGFNMVELLKYIKEISIYKSSGILGLSTRFFNDVMLYLPTVFLHLYSRVKTTCVFPDKWKIATVVLLPKCNNSKEASELRPVSLPGWGYYHISKSMQDSNTAQEQATYVMCDSDTFSV